MIVFIKPLNDPPFEAVGITTHLMLACVGSDFFSYLFQ